MNITTSIERILGIVAMTATLVFYSCEKPEGPGGRGVIKGQVIQQTYDRGFRVQQSEFPAADEDVYIIYGSGQTISDDRSTTPEGRFEFQYLSKGDYRIYVYSEDSTGESASGMIPVERSVNLSSNKQEVDLGEIFISRTLEVDEGQATIGGKVMQVNYAKGFVYIIDTIPAQDIDVYLIYEDDPHYFDRIRTLYDGSYSYPKLIKGTYTIYVYSEDINRGSELIPLKKNLEVDAVRGVFDSGIFYISKED
ncbi:hypothetical protein ACFLTA_04115 [Bacteroidota bacterium]